MDEPRDPAEPPRLTVFDLPIDPEPERAVEEDPRDNRQDEAVLRDYAHWFCQLRWIVAGTLALVGAIAIPGGEFARWGVRITAVWPLVTASILAVCNLFFLAAASRPAGTWSRFDARRQLWLQIIADLLVLTAVVHFLGTLETPAPFMYLFHIILACIFLTGVDSLRVSLIATVLYVACLCLESSGWLPGTSVFAAAAFGWRTQVSSALPIVQSVFVIAIWYVIWFLTSRLAAMVRHRERELAATNRRLAASSVERAQHMLQTTHQLKAPFAAIHANTQLLLGGFCGELPDQARAVVEKIAARSAALSQQIQEMLQLANLRSAGQLPPVASRVDLAGLVESTITHWEPAARQRQITFRSSITPVEVEAVSDHLRMLVDNLVANAVHYSFDGGLIDVDCRPDDSEAAVLSVRDHGIGIPAEKVPRVFDDYYRTEEAVRHNRSSTGLGLAIVRHVAQHMRIHVRVESHPKWGTRFSLTIPRTVQKTNAHVPAKEKSHNGVRAHR